MDGFKKAMASLLHCFRGRDKSASRSDTAQQTLPSPNNMTVHQEGADLQQQQEQRSETPMTPPIRTSDTAPQLPPLQTSPQSINFGSSNTNKPLPSTHPLATGKHESPQMAIPRTPTAAQLGPDGPSSSFVTESVDVRDQQLREQEPVSLQMGTISRTEEATQGAGIGHHQQQQEVAIGGKAVQGANDPSSPAPPPKTDSFEPLQSEKGQELQNTNLSPAPYQTSLKNSVESEVDGRRPADLELTTNSASGSAAATSGREQLQKENVLPSTTVIDNTTIPHSTTATSTQGTEQQQATQSTYLPNLTNTAAASTTASTDIRPTSAEEKMALKDEPMPPLSSKPFAPGMSATSGPLEDYFPEAAAADGDGNL